MIELVRKIIECEGTEEEIDSWLQEIKSSVKHPAVSDLIFYPENDDMTPEEIAEEVLLYHPHII